MKNTKQIGLWMDHATAHLIQPDNTEKEHETIYSAFTQQTKDESNRKGESHLHTKEQHLQTDYFKKISNAIVNYDEILLFGPTDAKIELLHVLQKDHRFANCKLAFKQSDKLTPNQQTAFVREHFLNH